MTSRLKTYGFRRPDSRSLVTKTRLPSRSGGRAIDGRIATLIGHDDSGGGLVRAYRRTGISAVPGCEQGRNIVSQGSWR